MTFIMSIKMALSSVWSSKIRSFLTMLGIIIGVAAVILLVSMVSASTKHMKTQLESMGTNLINVNINRGWGSGRSVSNSELQAFCDENSDIIAYCSPSITSRAIVKYGGENLSSSLYGISGEYMAIKNREVVSGRNFTETDIAQRHNVCIIGEYLKKELFGGMDPIDQEIKLNNEAFTIIGVLDQKTSNVSSGGEDDMVMIPYSKAQRLLRNAGVSSFVISAVSSDYTDDATEAVENFLFKKFKNDRYYNVMDQAAMMDTIDEALASMALLAAAIAGISLVVAGIGIMNIMLVTVTERTREIGIRKSIGAKTGVILMQFLVESAVISCIGGIIGIIVGVAGSAAICMGMGMPVLTLADQAASIIGSFFFSAAMGVFFGMYPAQKAAKLNPVDALRYD
ncbi:MAG: ABC transporter permease [Clostridia bacterium]|nr:ABC transporter permease [Clostridia bacterium]